MVAADDLEYTSHFQPLVFLCMCLNTEVACSATCQTVAALFRTFTLHTLTGKKKQSHRAVFPFNTNLTVSSPAQVFINPFTKRVVRFGKKNQTKTINKNIFLHLKAQIKATEPY